MGNLLKIYFDTRWIRFCEKTGCYRWHLHGNSLKAVGKRKQFESGSKVDFRTNRVPWLWITKRNSCGSKMKGHADVKLRHTLGHILNDTIDERNSHGLILWSNSSLVTRAADLKLMISVLSRKTNTNGIKTRRHGTKGTSLTLQSQ